MKTPVNIDFDKVFKAVETKIENKEKMKNLIGTKVGNVINLVIEGNAFQKTFSNQEEANTFFKLMHKARSGDEAAYAEVLAELNRRYKSVIKGILEKDSSDTYYLKGIDIPMPELLATTFLDYLENDFPIDSLVNFWKLLVTNPDPRVRTDLFEFLQHYNFGITDNGYFIAYKAVQVKDEAKDEDLAAFVSNQYLKIKKMKKNPAHYEIVTYSKVEVESVPNPDFDPEDDFCDDELEFIEHKKTINYLKLVKEDRRNEEFGTFVKSHGNLNDLFKSIDQIAENNRTVYESKHSGPNGRVAQVLGVPVKMDRQETNIDPKIACSSGLHVGSTKYVEHFANRGDVILMILVNPAHVVAVPEYDTSKIRTCEYFPYAVLDRHSDGKFEVIEEVPYYEEDYMKYEKADLEEKIETIQAEIDNASKPSQSQLDYKKILEERLVTLEGVLDK